MTNIINPAVTITLPSGTQLSGPLEKATYYDGSPAVILNDTVTGDHEQISVNLGPEYSNTDTTFFIKDYSEHKGWAGQLVYAGVVKKTGLVVTGDWDVKFVQVELI